MVILGLGCNLGDPLKQFRHAIDLLKQIPGLQLKQISPLYISDALLPENAPDDWNKPYLNLAIRCETTLQPIDLLKETKRIEKIVGRTPEKVWGPRIMDIDLLAWDDLVCYDKVLHIPHEHLHARPFALWPLTDVAPRWIYPLPGDLHGKTAVEMSAALGSRFDENAPLHAKQISQRVDTPIIMGILNITPDSFSDSHINDAIHHAHVLINAGAEVLDIGAEATGPNAKAIDSKIEWQRLEPVLKTVLQEKNKMLITPKISIDTRNADTAEKALSLGVDYINDVSGFQDKHMLDVLRNHHCEIIFMHNLGIPVSTQQNTLPISDDPIPHILAWANDKMDLCEKKGIARERLIFDVGIGFGKTAEQSLEIIRRIDEFKNLGVRLLVGHSRKSFLKLFTTKPSAERDIETTAISLQLAKHSIDFVRVHNVDLCARVFKVAGSYSICD